MAFKETCARNFHNSRPYVPKKCALNQQSRWLSTQDSKRKTTYTLGLSTIPRTTQHPKLPSTPIANCGIYIQTKHIRLSHTFFIPKEGLHYESFGALRSIYPGNYTYIQNIRHFGSKSNKERISKQQLQLRRLKKITKSSSDKYEDELADWEQDEEQDLEQGSSTETSSKLLKSGDLAKFVRQMDEIVEKFEGEFNKQISIVPRLDTFEKISVSTKDGTSSLYKLAQIVIRSKTLIVFNVYDLAHIPYIVKALQIHDSTYNPQDEGKGTLRLTIPKSTPEMKKHLLKRAKDMCENIKVQLRFIRKKGRDEIKTMKNPDYEATMLADFQKAVDNRIAKIDKLFYSKQQEIE